MSSFICSPKHFNSIEWNTRELIRSNRSYLNMYNIGKVYPVLNDRNAPEELINAEVKNIVDQLRSLNVLCVSMQYAHHHEGTLDQDIEVQLSILMDNRKSIKPAVLTSRELYNAFRCLNYQIETEHLKELRDLTEEERGALFFMREMINELAHLIISEMPSAGVSWSID